MYAMEYTFTISDTVATTPIMTTAIESTVKPMRSSKSPIVSQVKPLFASPPSPALSESRCDSSTKKKSTKTEPMAKTDNQSPWRGRKRPSRNRIPKAQTGIAGRIQTWSIQNI